jgi:Fic family protein
VFEAMSDLEKFHHDAECELPLLVRVALEHYQFETIHPFRDGNGRIGRLLIVLSLIERGRLPAPLLYPSRYFERNREQYADLLLRVSQKSDFVAWIQFVLRGLVESADDARVQVEGLLGLRERLQAKFQAARSSALLLKLVDRLFQSPAITLGDAARVLEVTPAAANANVHKLVEAGILTEVTGRKRNQIFVAKDIVAFIREEGGPVPEQRPLSFTPPPEV